MSRLRSPDWSRWHPDCPLRWWQRYPSVAAILYALALLGVGLMLRVWVQS